MSTSARIVSFFIVPFALAVVVSCSSASNTAVSPPPESTVPVVEERKAPEPLPETKAPETVKPEPTPAPKEPVAEKSVSVETEAPPATEPDEEAVPEEKTEPPSEKADAEPFDPKSIPPEVFDSTKIDVQSLIQRLNAIIRAKDYETWVTFLGSTYRAALSDRYFLDRVSASTVLRKQQITLRELRDYFIYVVVPSRANDRVDDIEFIGQNRVKAFTVDKKGRRLRLYDLEKTHDGWEIIN